MCTSPNAARRRSTAARSQHGANLGLAGLLTVLFATLSAALLALPANAYDPTSNWIRFALQGERPAPAGSGTYDRNFVREWEANPPKGFPTLAKENIPATKAAIDRYSAIVKDGGWPRVPEVKLEPGLNDPAVAVLRKRLAVSGDLRDADTQSAYFDYYVEKAVKRFQASNGLTPTGVVDRRTVTALNIPADVRLKQLKANLSRLAQHTSGLPKRFVVVNIPAAQVEAIENGAVYSRHAGVVGKVERQTPILRSAIHQLNFNPVWHLPPTVIEKDLIPKGRDMQTKGQSVLQKYHIDAYDGAGRKLDPQKVNFESGAARGLTFKQQPGKDNPLGFLKINFHNAHSVYMHDTPSESLFGRNFRAASSGCIRVQGIEQLATWLLSDDGWSTGRIEEMKKTGERKDVSLKRAVPLYFVYITAWATEDGVVQFRRDLYSRDDAGATAANY